jgi:nitrate reductase NapE component
MSGRITKENKEKKMEERVRVDLFPFIVLSNPHVLSVALVGSAKSVAVHKRKIMLILLIWPSIPIFSCLSLGRLPPPTIGYKSVDPGLDCRGFSNPVCEHHLRSS